MAEILRFELYGQSYGIPIADAEEILRAVSITPLPNAPRVIEGMINIHGDVTPVLDLRARFGLPAKPVATSDHLIVVNAGTRRAVIRADRVDGIVDIASADIARVDTVTSGVDHISGVAKLPDGLVLLHDLETFLSEAEGMALDATIGTYIERA